MQRCPRCDGEPDEHLEDGTYYCEHDRLVYAPQRPERLIDPEPRRRKDTDE